MALLFYTGTVAFLVHNISFRQLFNAAGSSVSISSTNISEPVLRLPPRYLKTFAIEVSSTKVVNEICIAESIDELRGI